MSIRTTTRGEESDRVPWQQRVGPILQSFDREGHRLASETADRIFKTYPAYIRVEDAALRASALANITLAIAVIRERRRATDEELEQRALVGGARARERVPVEQMLSAFGMTMGVLRDHLLELGRRDAVDATALLEATQIVWTLAEDLTVALSIAHRDAELTIARHDEHQRAEFLRQLLHGSLSSADLDHRAPAYGLDESRPYHALRGRPGGDGSLAELLRALEQAVRVQGGPLLLGVLDGDAVGIASSIPNLRETSATVGVGAAASLTALEPSFATASRVLEVARHFSMTGVLQLGDVSLRAAVMRETELGDLLLARHLGALDVKEGFADVVKETLRVFLANGMQIKRSAQQLDIHPNTLRYRLRRYEELTGADLSDTGILLELWWALERDRVVGGNPVVEQSKGDHRVM